MKFVSAKVVEKPKIEIPIVEKMDIESKSKAKGKSRPKSQRGPQVMHFCHHCGISWAHKTKLLQASCSQKG